MLDSRREKVKAPDARLNLCLAVTYALSSGPSKPIHHRRSLPAFVYAFHDDGASALRIKLAERRVDRIRVVFSAVREPNRVEPCVGNGNWRMADEAGCSFLQGFSAYSLDKLRRAVLDQNDSRARTIVAVPSARRTLQLCVRGFMSDRSNCIAQHLLRYPPGPQDYGRLRSNIAHR